MLYRRGQFLHAKHKAAVTGDAKHYFVWICDFNAKRSGKAETQRTLITGGYVGTRLINFKTKV